MRALLAIVFCFAFLQNYGAHGAVEVFFSGGGIRAAVGTVIAAEVLKKNNIEVSAVYALSGGTWGFMLAQGDFNHVCPAMRAQARTKDKLGPTSALVGKNTKYWAKWKQAIQNSITEMLFKGDNTNLQDTMKRTGTSPGQLFNDKQVDVTQVPIAKTLAPFGFVNPNAPLTSFVPRWPHVQGNKPAPVCFTVSQQKVLEKHYGIQKMEVVTKDGKKIYKRQVGGRIQHDNVCDICVENPANLNAPAPTAKFPASQVYAKCLKPLVFKEITQKERSHRDLSPVLGPDASPVKVYTDLQIVPYPKEANASPHSITLLESLALSSSAWAFGSGQGFKSVLTTFGGGSPPKIKVTKAARNGHDAKTGEFRMADGGLIVNLPALVAIYNSIQAAQAAIAAKQPAPQTKNFIFFDYSDDDGPATALATLEAAVQQFDPNLVNIFGGVKQNSKENQCVQFSTYALPGQDQTPVFRVLFMGFCNPRMKGIIKNPKHKNNYGTMNGMSVTTWSEQMLLDTIQDYGTFLQMQLPTHLTQTSELDAKPPSWTPKIPTQNDC